MKQAPAVTKAFEAAGRGEMKNKEHRYSFCFFFRAVLIDLRWAQTECTHMCSLVITVKNMVTAPPAVENQKRWQCAGVLTSFCRLCSSITPASLKVVAVLTSQPKFESSVS